MPYYAGDYYRGDYYRGDPGLLSFIGNLARKVIGLTPIGTAVGAAASILPKPPVGPIGRGLPLPGPFRIHPTRVVPGGRPFITREAGIGACPPGYHLAKDGSGKCVRNRSMNPANPRALRRAVRRQNGFIVLARRVMKGTGMVIRRSGFGKAKGRRR